MREVAWNSARAKKIFIAGQYVNPLRARGNAEDGRWKTFQGYTAIFQVATPLAGVMWIYGIILSRRLAAHYRAPRSTLVNVRYCVEMGSNTEYTSRFELLVERSESIFTSTKYFTVVVLNILILYREK